MSVISEVGSMFCATPSGQLQVNRCTDANRLDDLLTFMSNAILIEW